MYDDDIRNHLSRLIGAGVLPSPDADTYYAVHMPRGSTVRFVQPGGEVADSCQSFCAYHSWHEGIAYGVIPDVGVDSPCHGLCGTSSDPWDNQGSLASHELVEAITDPKPGKSWWSAEYNEISDVCNHQHGQILGLPVQLTWSNARGACILD